MRRVVWQKFIDVLDMLVVLNYHSSDKGIKYLRNVDKLTDYTTQHPKRQSSYPPP